MPFNISEFSASIAEYGVLQNNKFLVYFASPRSIQDSSYNTQGDSGFSLNTERIIQMRAEQARLPGIVALTKDVNRFGVGVVQKMPFNAQFTDTSITFIADANAEIYKYFYSWITSIVDFNGSNTQRGVATYKVGYKDDYATDIQIIVFDNYGNMVKTVTLYEAYPNTMNDIPLDWNNNNTLMKITVGFTFKEWSIEGVNNSDQSGQATTNYPTQANYPSGNSVASSRATVSQGTATTTSDRQDYANYGVGGLSGA